MLAGVKLCGGKVGGTERPRMMTVENSLHCCLGKIYLGVSAIRIEIL
jgi:hypothetical protein